MEHKDEWSWLCLGSRASITSLGTQMRTNKWNLPSPSQNQKQVTLMEGQCSLTINVVPIFCFFVCSEILKTMHLKEVRCKLQGRFSRTEVWMCFKECECVQGNGFYSSNTVFYLRSQYSACPKCWLFRALRRRNSANSQSRYDSYFNTCTSQQSWNIG